MTDHKPPRSEQELWRANTYQLLARLLLKPPSQRLIEQLAEIPSLIHDNGVDALGLAWAKLGEAARQSHEAELFTEYLILLDDDGGLLVPYASWHLAGKRNAKPLALVRTELAGLGMETSSEPTEDHAGSLCAFMLHLVEAEDPRQIGFFTRHLKPWLPKFFREMAKASSASFYRPVGMLGEAFIEVERIFLRETY